jgi:hypothetical protein
MTSMRWTTTVLACDDPDVVSRFWADLLGSEPERITHDFIVVKHGSCWLAAQRSREVAPATWPVGERPMQIHLDIAVTDLQAAVHRAVELGAHEEQQQPAPDRWRVLRAPGGHLFCLSHHIQDYLPLD